MVSIEYAKKKTYETRTPVSNFITSTTGVNNYERKSTASPIQQVTTHHEHTRIPEKVVPI